MEPALTAAGKKEVQAPAATRSMVGSLDHCVLSTLLSALLNTSVCVGVCLCAGGGGMRVGSQYQAVVPDYDPGKTLNMIR